MKYKYLRNTLFIQDLLFNKLSSKNIHISTYKLIHVVFISNLSVIIPNCNNLIKKNGFVNLI